MDDFHRANLCRALSSVQSQSAGLCIIATTLAPGAASAATVRRYDVSSVAVCSGPLPVYDANLRRRPLGILNQGTQAVFISCSVPMDGVSDRYGAALYVTFRNFGTANTTVNCTLNAGSRYASEWGSVTASTPVTTDSDEDVVGFNGIDRVSGLGSLNFSCVLPPSVEMGTVEWDEISSGDNL